MADEDQKQGSGDSGGKSRMLIWICLSLAFLVIFGVAGYFFMGSNKSPSGVPETSENSMNYHGAFVMLGSNNGEYITNLAPPDDTSFISTKVSAELAFDIEKEKKETTKLTEEIDALSPRIQQIIEGVFQSRTRSELVDPEGKKGVRQEIKRRINTVLSKGKVKDILLTETIIQGI